MIGLLLLSACGNVLGTAQPPPARSDAVAAPVAPAPVGLEGFCDARPHTPFALPALDEPVELGEGWLWVNLWATWCGPCIEEMPMISGWVDTLGKEGHPVELQLVSADAEPGLLRRFHAKHPDLPTGARVADADDVPGWVDSLGVSSEVGLPVHVFVDPAGRVDCVRAGALSRGNLAEVRTIVRQEPGE